MVLFTTEFGRTPFTQSAENVVGKGRDHNPHGFSIWMAGGSLKPGFDLGDTDEIGYAALDDFKVTHSDVHATILRLLGLDFKKLTFEYEGRNESLIGAGLAGVVEKLRERFGAVSSETQTIRGLWQHEGKLFRDDLVRVFVDVSDVPDVSCPHPPTWPQADFKCSNSQPFASSPPSGLVPTSP